ncbi:MAG TPA: purine-nucleoside phosphorylase [Candidatus Paceibacterota bacterium]
MSIHISANPGQIASRVLLPGDPLRAKFIAENWLTDIVQYNRTRNMLGFTGTTRRGVRVSIQGSGMGMPSLSIYVHELIRDYGVKDIIRLGSCGALQPEIGLREIILAQGSCSDSNINRRRFKGMDFAPIADWELLAVAQMRSKRLNIPVRVGNILATDTFYGPDPEEWRLWAQYGVLAVEMESAELYTVAARYGVKALSILTVSDSLHHGTQVSAEDRECSFNDMARLVLTD